MPPSQAPVSFSAFFIVIFSFKQSYSPIFCPQGIDLKENNNRNSASRLLYILHKFEDSNACGEISAKAQITGFFMDYKLENIEKMSVFLLTKETTTLIFIPTELIMDK